MTLPDPIQYSFFEQLGLMLTTPWLLAVTAFVFLFTFAMMFAAMLDVRRILKIFVGIVAGTLSAILFLALTWSGLSNHFTAPEYAPVATTMEDHISQTYGIDVELSDESVSQIVINSTPYEFYDEGQAYTIRVLDDRTMIVTENTTNVEVEHID